METDRKPGTCLKYENLQLERQENEWIQVCDCSTFCLDFWQGDEAKFQKSFSHGSGSVFVDKVAFDESTQADLVQISVPVMDGEKAIGAITFGIDVDKIE